MTSPSQSNRDLKKVRFGVEDELYNYPPGDYPESPSESGMQEEMEVGDGVYVPPPLVPSSPSSIRSISSAGDGPFTPPSSSSPPSVSCDKKVIPGQEGDDGRLRLNTRLTNPSMAWDTFQPPTEAVIPQLALRGKECAVLSQPRRLEALTLVHPFMRRWPIRIDLRRVEAFTVEDFYFMIYRHLYEPLPQLDVVRYGREKQLLHSHSKRCKEQRLNITEEPLRRIDSMQLYRMFCGLREVDGDAGCWELTFLPITR